MFEEYKFPTEELLTHSERIQKQEENLVESQIIEKTLCDFGARGKVVEVFKGNLITRFCIKPENGVQIKKIKSLKLELQYMLGVEKVEISIIGEKQIVALDIINKKSEKNYLGDYIKELKKSNYTIPIIMGNDLNGKTIVEDLTCFPNMIVTGTTGTGKSNLLNTFLIDILYTFEPKEVKLILIDTRKVNFTKFNKIPHLLLPTIVDVNNAMEVLKYLNVESSNRNKIFINEKVDNIESYNKISENKLSRIVVMIEDFCDLMLGTNGRIEEELINLVSHSRQTGIYIIISSFRSSTDIITGRIKANIPVRATFKLPSQFDSRTVINVAGAEDLLFNGDILFSGTGGYYQQRIQVPYVSEQDIENVVKYIEENNSGVEYESWKIEDISKDKDNYEEDPLLKDAIELVTNAGYASTSLIKRNFKIDYNRAGRIIDLIEERGIISEYQGAKPRSVLTEKKKIDDDEDKKNEMTKIEQEAKPYTDDDKIINQEKMDDFYDNAKYFIYSIFGIIILYWIIRWFMG